MFQIKIDMRYFLLIVFLTLLLSGLNTFAQNRPADKHTRTERFGITGMFRYSIRDWQKEDKSRYGNLNFDSFRIWAQTDINEKFYASVQFRIYEDWYTPHHIWLGYRNKNSTFMIGQTWVPFGIGYQPFDDWGNILFYVGLQDDYDYGLTWNWKKNNFDVYAGFFKNQQLSSDSRRRYDTDIFSGSVSSDDIITASKENQETNQLNLRLQYTFPINRGNIDVGLSGMTGQIYNHSAKKSGGRYAYAFHSVMNMNNFHFNVQGTYYNYRQVLPDSANSSDYRFLNVSSWDFAYEIPEETYILSASIAYDIIGEKLTPHINYSILGGGTAEANSQVFTAGVRTLWRSFEAFAEVYYGENDPQLSGNASGYGRNANSYDLRFDIRLYYNLTLLRNNKAPE